MKFFVTYGVNSNLANNYSVVEADTYELAHDKAFQATGGKFSFLYSEEGFDRLIADYHLTETPLQPMIMVML